MMLIKKEVRQVLENDAGWLYELSLYFLQDAD